MARPNNMTRTNENWGRPQPSRYVVSTERVDDDVTREIARIPEVERFPMQQCRICQEPVSQTMVNQMLAHMMPLSEIFRMVDLSINPNRAKNKKITARSVRHHAKNHFNVTEPSQAIYREMMERRAIEYQETQRQLGIEGVNNMLNVFGYLDVMAYKGYQNMVKDTTTVTPELGMNAILKLHELTRQAAGEQQNAELRHQLALIQAAVKAVVPAEYWEEIIVRLEDAEADLARSDIMDAEVVDDEFDDDDDEPYSPYIEADDNDSIED